MVFRGIIEHFPVKGHIQGRRVQKYLERVPEEFAPNFRRFSRNFKIFSMKEAVPTNEPLDLPLIVFADT